MKKPHLFFIKFFTNTSVHYYSMLYELEEVQSTTNSNIITIINDLIKTDKTFSYLSKPNTFNIKEIYPGLDESFTIADINRYLSNFIYFDKKINQWIISYKNKPDFKIYNSILPNKTLKLMLVGSFFDSVMKNEQERESLFDLFEIYYHIRPNDALIYKIQNENEIYSIEYMCECLPDDINKNYAIILQDGYNLSIIRKFTELCYNKKNIEVFVLSNLEYFKVEIDASTIIFRKVSMR